MIKIIAEFCQNHNGDFDLLKKMVEAAAAAGATHGKMQTIYADTVTYRPQFEDGLTQNGVIKAIKRPYKEEVDRLSGLEISEKETVNFIKICKENGLTPMTTCFTRSHVKNLSELGFRSIKVASYDCASFPLLRELKNKFDEIVVSTGATYDDEVIHAANILSDVNYSFLHCVTLYPTPLNDMHMARMEWLKQFTPSVGYSDHSLVSETKLIASKAALALGAELIERHFTLLNQNESRDGPVSINQGQLKELVDFSKLDINDRLERLNIESPNWRVVIGEKNRVLSDAELLNRDYYRGRFSSPREETILGRNMIYNYEDTPLL
jgi:N,N'-diacetyllegionaminate synthase